MNGSELTRFHIFGGGGEYVCAVLIADEDDEEMVEEISILEAEVYFPVIRNIVFWYRGRAKRTG